MSKQFKQQIIQVSRQGIDISEKIERGQADTPLADHFLEIEKDIKRAPFTIVLLGLTTEARTAALAWLYGKDFSVLSVNVVKQLRLIEISLRERGYTLEKSDGERQEFDKLDPFLDALLQSDMLNALDGKDWVEPIRLGVKSSNGLQGIKVYMPESSAMILENPGLLNRVVTNSNLLVVAAPLNYDLSDSDQKAILEISQNMDGFWPLLVVDELEEDTILPEMGWWQKHKSPIVQLKPQLLTTHVDANIPSMLQDIDDDTRQSLFLFHQAQRIIHACEAVEERCQQELRQLQGRKKREQRKAEAGEKDVKSGAIERHEWEELRGKINNSFTVIAKKLQDGDKKLLLPNSELMNQLDNFIAKLEVGDLKQEPGHKNISLTVNNRFIDDLKNQLKVQIKKYYKADTVLLSSSIDKQKNSIESELKQLTGSPETIQITRFDQNELWLNLMDMLNVSIRYRGEMPNRGFMARLSDGRKSIMGISMMAMVVGSLFNAVWGVDIRSIIMMFAPVIFIGAIVYSYVVWPKEDAERFNKELAKIKDGFSAEIKRLLSEIQREKQSKLAEYIENEKKNILKKTDDVNRHYQKNQEQAIDGQKSQAKQRITQIDHQIKELQLIDREIVSLKRDCDRLETNGRQRLSKLSSD